VAHKPFRARNLATLVSADFGNVTARRSRRSKRHDDQVGPSNEAEWNFAVGFISELLCGTGQFLIGVYGQWHGPPSASGDRCRSTRADGFAASLLTATVNRAGFSVGCRARRLCETVSRGRSTPVAASPMGGRATVP